MKTNRKIVYNVTMKVNDGVLSSWIQWMKEEHIPEVMTCGLMLDARFFVMEEMEEGLGDTYVVQYTLPSMEAYHQYLQEFAPTLRDKTEKRFNSHILAFRTHMHLLQEWKLTS